MIHSHSPESQSGPKRRAPVACRACHKRKVRCNVAADGPPCSNCARDGTECVLHVPEKRRPRRSRWDASGASGRSHSATHYQSPLQARGREDKGPRGYLPEASISPAQPPTQDQAPSSSSVPAWTVDQGGNSETLVNVVESPLVPSLSTLEPFFIGDSRCLRFLFNVLGEDCIAANSHYWVPKANAIPLPPEDLAFLQAKGALTLPSPELREELIKAYFKYVHPSLPVLDHNEFLHQLATRDISEMIVAPPSTSAYQTLYDFHHENNKITLIQSVLLMSYWFADTRDRSDSWHWVGVASSLGQTIGLHRDPGSSFNIPRFHRRQWRRVWWCCVHRDRWISLGMGRPTRIKMSDCDQPPLTADDLVDESSQVLPVQGGKYADLAKRCDELAPTFVEALKLSMILGEMLDRLYSASPALQMADIHVWETALQSWHQNLGAESRVDFMAREIAEEPVVLLHNHVLHLLFQAVVITLYRPLMFANPQPLEDPEIYTSTLAKKARENASFAATMATDSLSRLINLNLISKLPPFSVTVLSPVIAIHFVERWSATGLKLQVASQKLDLCMSVLSELGEEFWAANFNHKYFSAAFQRIEDIHRSRNSRNGVSTADRAGAMGASFRGGGGGLEMAKEGNPDDEQAALVSASEMFNFPFWDDDDGLFATFDFS
ncbi:hypothetical protein P168DRAFT_278962 [Aspergillus campestris IBT 28561]|uniref:Zn(2)-C6 fungal-type domain-containing protein n=1 Tax=Aspergillus campestris (strain IBT 28561) TaxID=1392248 RepID=A0A2I1DAP4_ASPC2|nr:uncharacterized protein P168DRAFT_278962 [Aspergillus campestris IBT 28561]PKY06946.1 hypothetical protein P168DRAFT_278962 [Aspergillus campestris IBT 28561]